MANSLRIKAARIDRELATLDRKIAFADFFPFVTAHFLYRRVGQTPARSIGGRFFQTADRGVADTLIEAELPVFTPEIWWLYSRRKTGEQTAELTYQRTRQLLTLQVTSLYYGVLCHRERQEYLHEAIRQAEALREEVAAAVRLSVAMPSDLLSVEAALRRRRSERRINDRRIRTTEAELLEVMGLSPLASIELARPPEETGVQGELADLVLRALLNRAELRAADRTIDIRTDEMRIAIARLLPEIYGLVDLTHTTNSFIRFATNYGLGVKGFLRVFDGFANLHEYAAARKRREAEFVRREQLCLAVILAVLRAHQHVQDTADRSQVAVATEKAAAAVLAEIASRTKEGLVKTSKRLEAQTRYERARADRTIAQYRHRTALATLADVVGDTR